MNQKLLCSVLSAAVLLGACPTPAFAGETTVTNHILDFRNATEDISNEEMGFTWDADSQVLTLEDFSITVPIGKLENDAAIYLPDESIIRLRGDNNEIKTLSYHCDAIYCEGELSFEGRGKLKIQTDSYSASSIYAKRGPVTFSDSVEITTDPEGHVIYVEKAKGSNPIISVQDDAKVTIPKEDANDRSVLVTKSSSVKTGENWFDYAEIYDNWDDTVQLVAKSKVAKPAEEPKAEEGEGAAGEESKTEESAPEETTTANEYEITIGSPAILKNGTVSYTADVSPYLSNGYTMLPLRALLEVSNPAQDVKWNAEQKTAHTFVKDKFVLITPNAAAYQKATESVALSTPAEVKNGRLFVSLRDWMSIMEIDSSQLSWDAQTKTVTLTY